MAVASPGDSARRRQGEEPLQRGGARGARDRTAVPGHPDDRPRKGAFRLTGTTSAGAPRGDHRRRLRTSSCSASATASAKRSRSTASGTRSSAKIRKKEQDSNYSGPDNDKLFVPFAAMAQDFPRPDVAARRGVAHHRGAEAGGRRRAARHSCQPDGPHRRHRLAACTRRPRRAGAAPRVRSGRSGSDLDVGHVGEDADVRPHGRHDAELLRHRRVRHARARRRRRDEHHADRRPGADAGDRCAQGTGRDDAVRSSGSSSSRGSS